VVIAALDGTVQRTLPSGEGPIVWSPDSTRIATGRSAADLDEAFRMMAIEEQGQ